MKLRHGLIGGLLAAALTTIFLSVSCSTAPVAESANRAPSAIGPREYAIAKLRKKGLSKHFLTMLEQSYHEDEREQVIELNVLGFLRAKVTPNTSRKVPLWELRRVRKFMRQHKRVFARVEKKYRVPKEIIASLLWTETKYGRDMGTFHVPSAFFSLVQADYPTILDATIEAAKEKAENVDAEVEAKIRERSTEKGEWAAGELKALEEIDFRRLKDLDKLTGSFSGAFGIPQFLPSSYLAWAKTSRHHQKPNLYRPEDSIHSVANYLSKNGWKKKSKQSQKDALFHYNRDPAYVNRILRMGECLRQKRDLKRRRGTASVPSC